MTVNLLEEVGAAVGRGLFTWTSLLVVAASLGGVSASFWARYSAGRRLAWVLSFGALGLTLLTGLLDSVAQADGYLGLLHEGCPVFLENLRSAAGVYTTFAVFPALLALSLAALQVAVIAFFVLRFTHGQGKP